MRLFLCFCLVLMSCRSQAQSVAWDTDGEQWLSSDSEHFQVHYLSRHQSLAQRALAIAEQVHRELLPFFNAAPEQRTHMVIVDDYDFSNGWATPLPFAQIRLFASPPQQVTSLEHNDDWLQSLIRHEYVHVLHMELEAGVVAKGRDLFGRVGLWPIPPLSFFPHAFTPSMLLEGLAVYLETHEEQGFGRLQGSYYSMQMRAEVMSGELDDMNSVIVAQRQWPSNRAYLYGAYFIEYLVETYGEQAVQDYLHGYSRQLLQYFLLDRTLRTYFGQSLQGLWDDFKPWLQRRFTDEIKQLTSQQSPSTQWPFTSDRRQPMATAGDRLWYVEDNGEDRPAVMLRENEQTPTFVAWAKGIRQLALTDQQQLAAIRMLSYADGRSWNDLFVLRDGQWQRLTWRQRLRSLQWHRQQQRWLATRAVEGRSELVAIDVDGEVSLLWRGKDGDVLGELAVSGAGEIVAAYKPRGQGWDLAKFIGHWQPLTHSLAVENSPSFLADGRLVFSADYDGVFDIWALNLAEDELPLERLSHVSTGAFAPLQWRKQVLWQQYSAQGFELHSAPLESLAAYSLQQWQGQYDYHWIEPKQYASESYQPWSTLRPRYWLPFWFINDEHSYVGIATSGQDALARHRYNARMAFDSKQQQVDWSASYGLDNRWLLSWQRQHQLDDVGIAELTRREDQLVLARQNLFAQNEDQWRWHLALTHEYERYISAEGPVRIFRGGIRESLLGLATTFDNRQSYLNVPGTGWGSYGAAVVESNDVIRSDYDGHRYQLEGRHTFDLPGRQTLTVAALAGYADDGAQPFRLGGSSLVAEQALFGRDDFSLRGYDSNAAVGHNIYRTQLTYVRWLGRLERNWDTWPLGLADWYGNVFVEQASAWNDGQSQPQLTSVGAELSAELILGYRLLLPLTTGAAYGFNDTRSGDLHWYLRTSLAF